VEYVAEVKTFVVDTMREYPETLIFLTLAIRFWFGGLQFGSFRDGHEPDSGCCSRLMISIRKRQDGTSS
jgi:hypothetical protein